MGLGTGGTEGTPAAGFSNPQVIHQHNNASGLELASSNGWRGGTLGIQ